MATVCLPHFDDSHLGHSCLYSFNASMEFTALVQGDGNYKEKKIILFLYFRQMILIFMAVC